MDNEDIKYLFISLCVFFAIASFLVFIGIISDDSIDLVNIKGLGEKMCAEEGLGYSGYEKGENNIPIISCKRTKPLQDGYLILEYGDD